MSPASAPVISSALAKSCSVEISGSASSIKSHAFKISFSCLIIPPLKSRKVIEEKIDKQGNREAVRAFILTAQYFRHNYASLLYDADVHILSAQKFLGHKDIKTTLAIYAHLSEKRMGNTDKIREAFRIKSSVAKSVPL